MKSALKPLPNKKKRDFVTDKPSRPKTTHHALSKTERDIIQVVRTLTWLAFDDLTDTMSTATPKINGSEYLILSLYAKGMSVRDIQNHLDDLYSYQRYIQHD